MAEKKTQSDTRTKAKVAHQRARNVGSKAAQAGAKQVNGFFDFIRSQGIVGLAVGLAIGTAAGASVKVIVDQLISPLVALLTQGVDLNSLKIVIKHATDTHPEVAIGWGAIVSSLITLIATAFVVYIAIHLARLDRLDKKKDK